MLDLRILYHRTPATFSKIGEEQTPEDAEDGPPELLFIHGGPGSSDTVPLKHLECDRCPLFRWAHCEDLRLLLEPERAVGDRGECSSFLLPYSTLTKSE